MLVARMNQNFNMKKNTHLDIVFTMENIEDLTSYCIVWGMFVRGCVEATILKSSNNANEITIDKNKFIVHLTPSDNKDLDTRRFIHEARITSNHGITSVVAQGAVIVTYGFTDICE